MDSKKGRTPELQASTVFSFDVQLTKAERHNSFWAFQTKRKSSNWVLNGVLPWFLQGFWSYD